MRSEYPYLNLTEQHDAFLAIIQKNPVIKEILNNNPFPHKHNWYLSAGCLPHTVWNYLTGREITSNINDYDLVYYDASDITKESEIAEQLRINSLFKHLSTNVEVINEARVHMWFEEDFGIKIDQYKSLEHAVVTFPTTSTTIGVRKDSNGFKVFSKFGFGDLFSMTVRANRHPFMLEDIYRTKCSRWKSNWPGLTVVPY